MDMEVILKVPQISENF